MAIIKCPHCKKQTVSTSDKCINCGKDISASTIEISNKNNKMKFIIICLIFILIISVAFVLIFYPKMKDKSFKSATKSAENTEIVTSIPVETTSKSIITTTISTTAISIPTLNVPIPTTTIIITNSPEPQPSVTQQIIYIQPDPVPQTEFIPDHSQEIASLRLQINNSQSNIAYYESCINDIEIQVVSYQSMISTYNDCLNTANIDFENAKNTQIKVYDAERGWIYQSDVAAAKEAEQDIQYYQGLIDDCNACILSLESEIEAYNSQIAIEQENIEIYNAQINSLS